MEVQALAALGLIAIFLVVTHLLLVVKFTDI